MSLSNSELELSYDSTGKTSFDLEVKDTDDVTDGNEISIEVSSKKDDFAYAHQSVVSSTLLSIVFIRVDER